VGLRAGKKAEFREVGAAYRDKPSALEAQRKRVGFPRDIVCVPKRAVSAISRLTFQCSTDVLIDEGHFPKWTKRQVLRCGRSASLVKEADDYGVQDWV
jgi:hypothetical protein